MYKVHTSPPPPPPPPPKKRLGGLAYTGSVVSYIEAGVTKCGISSVTISCLFLNNQSFYCVVCCSTDPSVPPDSSVYNISTSRGIEVTVDLDGLTRGQMYYCKVAATNTTSASCGGPVVGGVKVFCTSCLYCPHIALHQRTVLSQLLL